MPSSEAWKSKAACKNLWQWVDFFPEPISGQSAEKKAEAEAPAKAICAVCPVDKECLEYALEWKVDAGIWAGRNLSELRAERRRRRHQALQKWKFG